MMASEGQQQTFEGFLEGEIIYKEDDLSIGVRRSGDELKVPKHPGKQH